jgi:nitrite reductase/ring-hydroxylating ferredoxin subunit
MALFNSKAGVLPLLLHNYKMGKTSILTFFVLMVASTACKKQQNMNTIPNVAVQEFVYLNTPEGFNLQVQGGWTYYGGGYKGLVVYRRYFNFQFDDFIAYDRACPLHWQDECGILKVVDNIYLECSCTGHQYLLFDGMPTAGDSPALRFYNTQFDGQNTILITN